MALAIASRTKLTPPQLAAQWGVKPATVIGWIRSGKLPAINIGQGLKKPRFLIGPDDIAVFENLHRVQSKTLPPRGKHKPADPPGFIRYF